MRIVHIGVRNYPPAHGGVEKMVFDLVNFLKSEDFFILSEKGPHGLENVQILPVNFFAKILFIYRFVKKLDVNVLHFHKETYIPLSVFFSLLGFNVILTIHGCAWRLSRWNLFVRCIFFLFDIIAVNFVRKVVFVSEVDYNLFKKVALFRKIYYIPNGVQDYTETYRTSRNRTFVYIGRISKEKNLLRMVRVLGEQGVKFTLFGPFNDRDPKYFNQVLECISQYESVNYGGVLQYTEILPTLANYDTLCNFSFSEGLPVSVLEGASVGLNLILSDIPQHRILNFPSVYFVNPYNPSISSLPDFLGCNRQHLNENFNLKNMSELYLKLYIK